MLRPRPACHYFHINNNIKSAQRNLGTAPRLGALSHTYAVKSPLVTMARPKFAPKSIPSRGRIPKQHNLPHPWTRPTYDAKRHLDPSRRFATGTQEHRKVTGRRPPGLDIQILTVGVVQREPASGRKRLEVVQKLLACPMFVKTILK